MMISNGSRIECDGISILEYYHYPNGDKGYQVTWKTDSFTHITYLMNTPVERQSTDALVAAAKKRIGWR